MRKFYCVLLLLGFLCGLMLTGCLSTETAEPEAAATAETSNPAQTENAKKEKTAKVAKKVIRRQVIMHSPFAIFQIFK